MPNIKKYKTKKQLRNRELLSEICACCAFVGTFILMVLGFCL